MNKDSAQCIFSGSADWRKFCGHYESMMELFHKMIWDRHSQLGGISGELLRSHFCLILYVQVLNFVELTNRVTAFRNLVPYWSTAFRKLDSIGDPNLNTVHCVQKYGPNWSTSFRNIDPIGPLCLGSLVPQLVHYVHKSGPNWSTLIRNLISPLSSESWTQSWIGWHNS